MATITHTHFPADEVIYSNGYGDANALKATMRFHASSESGEFVEAVDIGKRGACNFQLYACFSGTIHFFGGPGGYNGGCAPLGCNAFYIQSNEDPNFFAVYGHTNTHLPDGTVVKSGDKVALAGTQGASSGCHVHFAITNSAARAKMGGEPANVNAGYDHTKTNTYRFVTSSDLLKVDNSKVIIGEQGEGDTHQTNIGANNQQPTNIVSIVPEKIAFVYEQKVEPTHWSYVYPVHNGNVGGVHTNVELPRDGVLEKVLLLNHSGNVVAEQDVLLDLKKGDLINLDYTYSIQRFSECSELPQDKALWKKLGGQILHSMTEHTLDWKDGHLFNATTNFDNNDYDEKKEGTGNGNDATNDLVSLFGSGAIQGSPGGSISGDSSWNENITQTANALKKYLPANYGSNEVIAGIMGNIKIESNFNPHIHQTGGPAQGLFQWQDSRLTALFNHFGVSSIDQLSIDQQVEYAIIEWGPRNQANPMPTGSAEAVARWWDIHWEVSSGEAREKRVGWANSFFSQMKLGTDVPSIPHQDGSYSGNFIRR